MDYLIKEFDLNMMKNNHILEMSIDKYEIFTNSYRNLYESYNEDVFDNYYKESENLLNSLSNFFKSIYEAIAKFCNSMIEKIRVKIQTVQLKALLGEAKKKLINSKLDNKTITVFDIPKYLKAYDKWIEWEMKGTTAILNGRYKNQVELTNTITKFEKESDKYRAILNLDKKDVYKLNMNIAKTITYTDNQLENIKRLGNLPGAWQNSIKQMENSLKGEPDSNKIGFIKRRVNVLNTVTKKAIGFIAGAFLALAAIIAGFVKAVDIKMSDPKSVLS